MATDEHAVCPSCGSHNSGLVGTVPDADGNKSCADPYHDKVDPLDNASAAVFGGVRSDGSPPVPQAEPQAKHRFEFDMRGGEFGLEDAVGQTMGYVSMCWDPKPAGVFDSSAASDAMDQLLSFLRSREEAAIPNATFREALASLINRHNKENGSDTPDFLLAQYLGTCLVAFDNAVKGRDAWYGIQLMPGGSKVNPLEGP